MIGRTATFLLVGLLAFSTSPAFACTGMSLDAQDGGKIRGRTLEFALPLKSNVLVIPAGIEMSGSLPKGAAGLTYKTRYGMVGANAVGSATTIVDGLNDQGLSIGLFYFPDFAKYEELTEENTARALAPQDFGTWVLGNFATVDEVKAGLADIALVDVPFPNFGSAEGIVVPVHFFVRDKSGKSIAIEPVDGKLVVTDAPLGVITNPPTYAWQMVNLDNYLNLQPKSLGPTKLGPVTLNPTGSGTGMLGLPGDFTPPSRFVRSAMFSQNAPENETTGEAVYAMFHLLNNFDIPKGSIINESFGKDMTEITEWTSVNDLTNLRFYIRTYQDQRIRVVDLEDALKAANGAVMKIDIQSAQYEPQDITADAKPLSTSPAQ